MILAGVVADLQAVRIKKVVGALVQQRHAAPAPADKKGGGKVTHSVQVTLIADQVIEFLGDEINICDIETIVLDPHGQVCEFYMYEQQYVPSNIIKRIVKALLRLPIALVGVILYPLDADLCDDLREWAGFDW